MSVSGREALPDVREWSGERQPMTGRFSQMSRVVGKPPECPGVVGRHSRICGSGRKALPDVLEALLDIREWSGGPPGCQGMVTKLSRLSGSGRKSLSDVREW